MRRYYFVQSAAVRLLLCATCAIAQLRLLERASGLGTSLDFVMHTALGRADWAGYESRVLAPALIRILGGAGRDGDMRAFLALTLVGLFIGGLLSWRLANGPAGLGIYHAAVALLANPWFSPWDIFETVIFTAFVLLVVEEKPTHWFVLLFVISIFNRQSAMFIALYMVLSRRMIFEGMACAAFGFVVMYILQHSGLPKLGLAGFGTGLSTDYFRTVWFGNLSDIVTGRAIGGGFDWGAVGTLLSVLVAGVALVLEGYETLGVTFLVMLGATFMFATVTETRVFFDFISLFVIAATRPIPPADSAQETLPYSVRREVAL